MLLQEKVQKDDKIVLSVVLFRLNNEWFALNTHLFAEIAPSKKCHYIPHRSTPFLLGFVNLRGQFVLCISLYHLLSIPLAKTMQKGQRLLALEKDDKKFAFYADEVFGVCHCPLSLIQTPSVQDNYLKGFFTWEDHKIGLLDESFLFQNFHRSLCEQK